MNKVNSSRELTSIQNRSRKLEAPSEEFLRALQEINRNRVLLLMLARQRLSSNAVALSLTQATVLALLWELDDRQNGSLEQRVRTNVLANLLRLNPNSMSSQIVYLNEHGLCKELASCPGQDRRARYYVITGEGKKALNHFLDEQYKLADAIYGGVEMDRVSSVLEILRQNVRDRINELFSQVLP